MKSLLILILPFLLFGISESQLQILQMAYNIGKSTVADDGMTFEQTAASIALVESSAGLRLIGDQGINGKLRNASMGVMQVRLSTAKEVIKKDQRMNKYFSHLLHSDQKLISMLLGNHRFNLLISLTYLRMQYDYALLLGYPKPYFRAISRYNGGNYNTLYFNRVIKARRLVQKLITNGTLKVLQ